MSYIKIEEIQVVGNTNFTACRAKYRMEIYRIKIDSKKL